MMLAALVLGAPSPLPHPPSLPGAVLARAHLPVLNPQQAVLHSESRPQLAPTSPLPEVAGPPAGAAGGGGAPAPAPLPPLLTGGGGAPPPGPPLKPQPCLPGEKIQALERRFIEWKDL